MRLRSGDKHHPRKSADRKAQIRKAFVSITGLICALRSADFLGWCLSPERNLTHNLFFYFQYFLVLIVIIVRPRPNLAVIILLWFALAIRRANLSPQSSVPSWMSSSSTLASKSCVAEFSSFLGRRLDTFSVSDLFSPAAQILRNVFGTRDCNDVLNIH